ncbi:hypothetical protein SKAU_G00004410 [Synaphobranchus kaupii]|uniref:Uncharacterized protein n=1 Tax=Synaphobranchus kaupii TaxID=118154 RepID=A0A9Q1JBJ4_SYNKA|nr:hypothetical protein SKAU_G00004410 [Synaphobranchus kaupii]
MVRVRGITRPVGLSREQKKTRTGCKRFLGRLQTPLFASRSSIAWCKKFTLHSSCLPIIHLFGRECQSLPPAPCSVIRTEHRLSTELPSGSTMCSGLAGKTGGRVGEAGGRREEAGRTLWLLLPPPFLAGSALRGFSLVITMSKSISSEGREAGRVAQLSLSLQNRHRQQPPPPRHYSTAQHRHTINNPSTLQPNTTSNISPISYLSMTQHQQTQSLGVERWHLHCHATCARRLPSLNPVFIPNCPCSSQGPRAKKSAAALLELMWHLSERAFRVQGRREKESPARLCHIE